MAFLEQEILAFIKDGEITITGRAKDEIILNGINYYVQDIEYIVDSMEGIKPAKTLVTSVLVDNNEELLILFEPENEELYSENIKINPLISEIKLEVQRKCNIFPKYVAPFPNKRSFKTELGKKQRNKYRKSFYNGELTEIFGAIDQTKSNSKIFIETVYTQKIIEKRQSDDWFTLSDDILYRNRFFPNARSIDSTQLNLLTMPIKLICFLETKESDSLTNNVERHIKKLVKLKSLPKESQVIFITKKSFFVKLEIFSDINGILRGLIKSFDSECSHLKVKHVDFDIVDSDILIDEVNSLDNDSEIIYRNNKRYRLVFQSLDKENYSKAKLANANIVVLLGGLGGIGKHLSAHLVEKYGSKLIILGRGNAEERKSDIKELENLGKNNIFYSQIKNLSTEELEEAVNLGEKYFKNKADLFINLVGKMRNFKENGSQWENIEDSNIENITTEDIQKIVLPKLESSISLNELAIKRDSTLILFGSINSYFGGAGLALYSLANSYQNNFALHQQNLGHKVFCINWSNWKNIGLSSDLPSAIEKISENKGYFSLPVDTNLAYFDFIFSNGIESPFLGLDDRNESIIKNVIDPFTARLELYCSSETKQIEKIKNQLISSNMIFEIINVKPSVIEYDVIEKFDLQDLEKMNYTKKYSLNENLTQNEKKMKEIWQEILKVTYISQLDDFFSLGGNSVSISQLLFKISREFSVTVSFSDILKNSRLIDMAKIVGQIIESQTDTTKLEQIKNDELLNLKKEMDTNKIPLQIIHKEKKNILITGANGFLGTYILHYLVDTQNYNIYLLLRGDGKEKLQRSLDFYKIPCEGLLEDITILNGDLEKENLGLSEKNYLDLSNTIDVIVHAGARVNFILPYEELKATNVDGTKRIIEFACKQKLKQIHYISSFSIYEVAMSSDNVEEIIESAKILVRNSDVNAYTFSKYIADLFMLEAKNRGIPINIFRVGTATGDSKYGACQKEDFFWLLIKACARIEMIPNNLDIDFNLIPVDSMAKVIVNIIDEENFLEEPLNIINAGSKLEIIAKWLINLDNSILKTNYKNWYEKLLQYVQTTGDQEMASILAIFPEDMESSIEGTQRVNSQKSSELIETYKINMDFTADNFNKSFQFIMNND